MRRFLRFERWGRAAWIVRAGGDPGGSHAPLDANRWRGAVVVVVGPASEYGFPCSVARVTDLIGDPWTPLILRDAVLGVRRYDDFHRLQGIGRNTLSQRLRKLVDTGILYTRLYQDNPPRNEYLLTDKGRDLFSVLAAMLAWGDRWLDDGSGKPIAMQHRVGGHEVRAETVCSDCGQPLFASDVRFGLGEGFPPELADRPDVRLRYETAPQRETANGQPPGSG